MKRKRSISIFLVLVLMFCMMPAAVFAGENNVQGIKIVTFNGEAFTPSGTNISLSVPFSFTGSADLSKLKLTYTDEFNSSYISQGFTVDGGTDMTPDAAPKTLNLNYKDKDGDSTYSTAYSVSMSRAPKVDPEFSGTIYRRASVKDGAVKLTQADFTGLYTKNDGAAMAGVYISGGDLSVAALKLSAELNTVSDPGARVTLAEMNQLTVVPKGPGSTSFRITAYDADGNNVGAASLDVDVVATTVVGTVTASITQLQTLDVSTLGIPGAFRALSGKDLAAIKITNTPAYGSLVSNYVNDSSYGTVLVKDKLLTSDEFSALTYLPKRSIVRNSTETINYVAYDEDDNQFTGTITISITYKKADLPDLSASVRIGNVLSFSTLVSNIVSGYNRQNLGSFSYVEFKLPDASEGELRYNYTSARNPGSAVLEGSKYYQSGSGRNLLNNVSFIPSARSSGTCYIYYTAFNTNNTNGMTGRIRVTVSASSIGTVTAEVAKDEVLSLADVSSKINASFKSVTGINFSYLQFTELPNASTAGTLYYNYNSSTGSGTRVSTSQKYYRTGTATPLSNLSFVPGARANGSVNLYFNVYDTDGNSYSGTLEVSVSASMFDVKTINYSLQYGKTVKLSATDINNAVRNVSGNSNFEYLYFTSLPSTRDGILYHNYVSESKPGTRVLSRSSYTYYRSGSSNDLVNDLTVVPAEGFSGTLEFEYMAYVSSREYYAGKIVVTVKEGGSTLDTFELKTGYNRPVTFSLADFTKALGKYSSSNLDYIQFTAPNARFGNLYYNYISSSGKYDYRIGSSDKLYRRGSSRDLISGVSFVPATNYSGSFVLNFTAFDENERQFSGSIKITVGGSIDSFTDVPATSPYYKGIKWAVENGIAEGISATNFGTHRDATRAEIVYFMWNAAGSPEPRTTVNPFTDIGRNDVYYKAVLWAVEESITYGTTATTFTPGRTVNRGEAMCFLYRQIGSPAPRKATNPFYDIPANYYCHDAVSWATENGVTVGTDSSHYSPRNGCIRGQIVTFLYRHYVEKVGH